MANLLKKIKKSFYIRQIHQSIEPVHDYKIINANFDTFDLLVNFH